MATLNIPGQNLSFTNLPEEGEIFTTGDKGQIFYRQGNRIVGIDIENLSGINRDTPGYSGTQRYNLGVQALLRQGIDVNKLNQRSEEGLAQLEKTGGFALYKTRNPLEISFPALKTPTTNEVITQTPQGEQGVKVASSTGGTLFASNLPQAPVGSYASQGGFTNLNAIQQAQYNNLISAGASQSSALNAVRQIPVTPITPQNLEPTTGYNVSTPTFNTTGATSTLAGAQYQSNQAIQQAQQAQGQAQTKYDQLANEISTLIGQNVGEQQAIINARASAGVPGIQADLDSINSQIETKLAQYNALSTEVAGRPISLSSIVGLQTQIKNQAAAEIGLLQARASALQRNLDSAIASSDAAVEAKYQYQTDIINAKLDQLRFLKDDLTAAEQKTANLLNQQYQEQQNAINEQKAQDKAFQSAKLSALASGKVDASTANQAESLYNSGRVNEAYDILSPAGVTPTGGGGNDQPLSVNGIDLFRRSYGWTPPAGYSWNQLIQFMNDNPGATPEELEATANGVTQTTTTDRTTLEGVKSRIADAKTQGYTDDQIKSAIKDSYTTSELFTIAKEAGYAKWYTGKATDIDRMLNSLLGE